MKLIAPNYYKYFHCIADRCRHSCCIGWEIDIDEDSLSYYESIDGAFGAKLASNIEKDEETAHFRLVGKSERCPFLKENGLCEMILTLGEESLCNICREHPRFYLSFSDRDEVGLGLCCEEAARLILSQTEPTVLETVDDDGETEALGEWEQELIRERRRIFDRLQSRELGIRERARRLLSDYGVAFPEKSPSEWCDLLLTLERLDDGWRETAETLRRLNTQDVSLPELPFEKLLLAFVYRHTADAEDREELAARIAFSYFGYLIIGLLCEAKRQQSGTLTQEDIVDLTRRYSAEIEYSEDNTATLIRFFAS